MDSRLRGNDDSSANAVIPAKAGIHESRGGRGTSIQGIHAMDKQPKNPFHPGEMLLDEFLKPMGMSQAAFAARIDWTRTRLNEFIRGKRGVTAGAALDLADALGTSPKLWMNLQATCDLDKAVRAKEVA